MIYLPLVLVMGTLALTSSQAKGLGYLAFLSVRSQRCVNGGAISSLMLYLLSLCLYSDAMQFLNVLALGSLLQVLFAMTLVYPRWLYVELGTLIGCCLVLG